MTHVLSNFSPMLAAYSGNKQSDLFDLLANSRLDISSLHGSVATIDHSTESHIEVSAKSAGTLMRSAPVQTNFAERIFDNLVSLKVAISQYAMHLPIAERYRIFERLDSVINLEDWHEEDELPQLESFRNFLKWMIYSKCFNWSSIGVSNDGNILVAWSRPNVVLTANFSMEDKVTWSAAIETESGFAHAVGTCSLKFFAKQAFFYLDEGVIE